MRQYPPIPSNTLSPVFPPVIMNEAEISVVRSLLCTQICISYSVLYTVNVIHLLNWN